MPVVYDKPTIQYDGAAASPPPQTGMLDREDQAPTLTPDEAAGGLSGLGEGAKRFWAGIGQLGAGVHDAWDLFVWGRKSQNAAEYTAAENARQAAGQAAADTHGPEYGGGFQGGAVAGQTALTAAATAPIGAGSTGFLANVAKQGLAGTAAGALAFSPTNDKGSQALVGGGLGAALAVPAGAIPAAFNRVANAIRSTGARSEAAYQASKAVMGYGTPEAEATGGEPTLAMRTGSPAARSLEAQTFNARLQEKYQRISDYFATRFRSVFGLPDAPPPALDDAFTAARSGAETAVNGMRRAASEAYDAGMARAAALSDQVLAPGEQAVTQRAGMTFQQGGAPVASAGPPPTLQATGARVRATNFSQMLGVLSKQDADPVGGSQVLPKEWVSTVQARLQAGQGTLSVKDTAGVLRRLSGLRDADDPQLRALANKLNDSFNTDLDLVAQDGSGAHPAVQQILDTRAAYKASQDSIRALQDTAAYRFLGLGPKDTQVDPADLVKRFSAFTPEKQDQIAAYMRANTPQLWGAMRGNVLATTAAAGLRRAGPAAMSEVSPSAMIDSLFGDGQVLRTSGLWTPQERMQFEGFRQAMRVLNNVAERSNATGAGTVIGGADIAPNIVSRSAIFIARQAARVLTAGKGDYVFTSPTAVNYWTKIRNTSGPTQTAAIVGYANYLASLGGGQNNGQGSPGQ